MNWKEEILKLISEYGSERNLVRKMQEYDGGIKPSYRCHINNLKIGKAKSTSDEKAQILRAIIAENENVRLCLSELSYHIGDKVLKEKTGLTPKQIKQSITGERAIKWDIRKKILSAHYERFNQEIERH